MPQAHLTSTGDTYGELTVLDFYGVVNKRRAYRCICTCGTETVVAGKDLRNGHTRSCGCRKGNLIHGHGRRGQMSPTYNTWVGMTQRCANPETAAYPWYGGRGIAVCDAWKAFPGFLAAMGERPEGRTLDRINVDGNYEPGNCRWATKAEQSLNRRRSSWYDAVKDYGQRTCDACGSEFTARHPKGRFCSGRCKSLWHNRARRALLRAHLLTD